MEGKGAAAVGTRWAAEEATTAAADTEPEAVPELQTKLNVGHLKCHKPVCGDCEESGGNLQTVTSDHNGSLF